MNNCRDILDRTGLICGMRFMIAIFGMVAAPLPVMALGNQWQRANPQPTNQALHAIGYDGSHFIAVGAHGCILSSANGTTWVPAISAVTESLNGVACRGTQVVVVGDNGALLTSADAVGWTARVAPESASLHAVADSGSLFAAVGDDGTLLTSSDGVAWVQQASSTTLPLRGIGHDNGLFVAVGDAGKIITSANGTTWAATTAVTANLLSAVTSSGSVWIAVGDRGTILSSSDGTTWAAATSGTTAWLRQVVWDSSQFIACGDDGSVLTSPNGTTWTVQSSGITQALHGMVKGGASLVAVGGLGTIATSADGTAWTPVTTGFASWINAITWTGSLLVAVGPAGVIQTSPDGMTWTSRTSGTSAALADVLWTGSQLVAVGSGGAVLTSPDGTVWTVQSSGTTKSLLSVTMHGLLIVAVGRDSAVFTSSNGGIGWTSRSVGNSSTQFQRVASSGTKLVAVGDKGAIYTSSDGVSWSSATSGVTTGLEGITWADTQFVAVGAAGTVLTSPTGSTWTSHALNLPSLGSVTLHSVTWTGTEIAALGAGGDDNDLRGLLLTSPDASAWTELYVGPAPLLTSLTFTTNQPVLAGADGTVLLGLPEVVPVVQFTQLASQVAEGSTVVQVAVSLDAPSTRPVSVSFTVGGTATIGSTGDCTLSTSPLKIAAGQSTATITVTVKSDVLDEDDETVLFTLTSPISATLGANTTHTLTIQDNDTKATIGTQQPSLMVRLNDPVTLSANATGDAPITYQWRKGTTNITGATNSTYAITKAALAHAGTYSVVVKNAAGPSVTSAPIELGVVDQTNKTQALVFNKTATLTLGAAGNGQTWQWRKGVTPVTDDPPRITGATTKTLVIRNLVHDLVSDDSGAYVCDVTGPGGPMSGGTTTLTVIIPPVIDPVTFPSPLSISELVNLPITAINNPTRYVITGLPTGLTYSTTTGLIKGRPTVVKSFPSISIIASNAAGSSPPVTGSINVLAMPTGTVGSYLGTVARDLVLNSELGGRISVTTSGNGTLTGSLLLGTANYPFTSALNTTVNMGVTELDATAGDFTIARTGKPSLHLVFGLNPATGIITGTVTDGTNTAAFTAMRAMAAPFTAYQGYHTFAMQLAPGDVGGPPPSGHSYGYFTVGSTGVATGSFRLADNTVTTLSATLRVNNTLVIYNLLYTKRGSLLGTLKLTPGSPNLVGSDGISWFKMEDTSLRSYRGGFRTHALSVAGARYTAPGTSALVMDLTSSADNVSNTKLVFAEGGIAGVHPIDPNDDPAIRLNCHFRLTPPAVRDLQTPLLNPGKVTITITASSGLFSGTFSLTDTDYTVTPNKPLTRTVSYYGIIARDTLGVLRGFGSFQLPMMPEIFLQPNWPPTTITTSPILSGRVELSAYP